MLSNLKAELVRKNLVPEIAIREVLGCTDKTARTKLSGVSDFSLTEAIKIMNRYFQGEGFRYEDLFFNFATESNPAQTDDDKEETV